MLFEQFIKKDLNSVKLIPIARPNYDYISFASSLKSAKKDPGLYIGEVLSLKDADSIYGNIKRMPDLEATILLDKGKVDWKKVIVINHSAATLYNQIKDVVLPGFLENNTNNYDIHYILKGNKDIIEDIKNIIFLNDDRTVGRDFPFMSTCLVGRVSTLSDTSRKVFGGLLESIKVGELEVIGVDFDQFDLNDFEISQKNLAHIAFKYNDKRYLIKAHYSSTPVYDMSNSNNIVHREGFVGTVYMLTKEMEPFPGRNRDIELELTNKKFAGLFFDKNERRSFHGIFGFNKAPISDRYMISVRSGNHFIEEEYLTDDLVRNVFNLLDTKFDSIEQMKNTIQSIELQSTTSPETFDTFKGLYESTDNDYHLNFKILDTLSYDDYPDHYRNNTPSSIDKTHYFLVEYRQVVSKDKTIFKKGVMYVNDMEYGFKGKPIDMVRGRSGTLSIYDSSVSEEDILNWWKEHIFSAQKNLYGLRPAVVVGRRLKTTWNNPEFEKKYNRPPVGYFDYCEIESRSEMAHGHMAENFRDFINHYFVDNFHKLGKLKISTVVGSETSDIFGGLYEGVKVDNFEILAAEQQVIKDMPDMFSMIVIFKYKGSRYVMVTNSANRADWDVKPPRYYTDYNTTGTVFIFKDDVPQAEGIPKGLKLEYIPDHLKVIFGKEDPMFIGLVTYYGNREDSEIKIGERTKSEYMRDNYTGSVFLTYLFDFIRKHLTKKESIDAIINRTGLGAAASDETLDVFSGLYESVQLGNLEITHAEIHEVEHKTMINAVINYDGNRYLLIGETQWNWSEDDYYITWCGVYIYKKDLDKKDISFKDRISKRIDMLENQSMSKFITKDLKKIFGVSDSMEVYGLFTIYRSHEKEPLHGTGPDEDLTKEFNRFTEKYLNNIDDFRKLVDTLGIESSTSADTFNIFKDMYN